MTSAPAEVVFSLCIGSEKLTDHDVKLFPYGNGLGKVPGPWKRGRPKGSFNRVKEYHNIIENEPTSMQYEFINVTKQSKTINKTSRALIRKHAKLNHSRQRVFRYEPTPSHHEEIEKTQQDFSRKFYRYNLRQISGVDPFDVTPIKLEPYMHDLLLYFSTTTWKIFYSLEELAGCNPMAEYWLPLAFQDCALMHSFIGCSDVYVSGYKTIKNRLRGLEHLNAAISLVNQRFITGKGVDSLGTLAVIAGIALLEKGAGRHDHWRTHMQGLKQLVDIRGGLESLHSEPLILNKIYRADLYGSLDASQLPYFDKPLPLLTKLSSASSFHSQGFNNVQELIELDEALCTCLHYLEDASIFWSADNYSSNTGKPRSDISAAQRKSPTPAEAAHVRYLLTNVQYTLISINFEQNSDIWVNQIFELCRITLIIYSLTILNERPASTTVGQQVSVTFRRVLTPLVGQFRDLDQVQDPARTSSLLPLPVDFCLWAIFLAISVIMPTESDTKDWLIVSFLELASSDYANINNWNELKSRLSQYLWVPSIHDQSSRWLWSDVAGSRERRYVPCS